MTQFRKFVCKTCGGDNVSTEAYANWDTPKQAWVLDELVCEGLNFCGDCSEERDLDYVPVTDLRTLAECTIEKEKGLV